MTRIGISGSDIMLVLTQLRMEAFAVKISPGYCLEMPLPAILHWEQSHFVVLYKVDKKKGKFYVADPARGKIAYNEEEFNSYWVSPGEEKGIAIVTIRIRIFLLWMRPRLHWMPIMSG